MTIRWGIVGSGKICQDFVNAINSYPKKGDMVVSAVAARENSRAAEFAKCHNISKVFGSYAEMAESKEIDVAYVGALNPYHYELSKLFLESGKHVVCEKPLCLNYKQSESLIKIAKEKNLFLMEGVWSRFSPLYISLENEIESGKLGKILFVEVNLGHPIANIGRISKKELGGSAILDMGVYALQFAQFIFKDEPIKVTAVGELNEDGVDLVDTVVLEYSESRRAVLNIHSKVKLWNKATVVGTLGRSTIEDPFHFPNQLTHVNGTVENFCLHTSPNEYNFQNSAGLVYEAIEVSNCIRNGLSESTRMTHKDSLILSKLMDEVRKQVGVHLDVDDKNF
ncbi:trans-1,2-dihydrobenzene-1,2-diol dehydrogenase-like [Pararge aegeria]|uniref:trans-1,2-dihydrobenzene-1,2-diol dehydrogenase-like n=1 Tax=Pararge aegeria TaxID=116150 RepID=UPI0019D09000|nr:trans-1,2-dihydrobenzene-1,2-diol dehydrogenase-like [Pararge aegeria]XP_039759824.1 trans-1,2-dihydrobenzene-1,2-diol dehydrogenase-like [Pararge aegeria]